MKSKLLLASTASILTIVSSMAFAQQPFNIDIACPYVGSQKDMLSNYGDYIGGYGQEKINNEENASQIYFKSKGSIKDVPAQLDDYINNGVKYNSTTGDVTCAYASSAEGAAFEVSYTLTNGKGGKASMIGNNEINILLPVGFKS